MKLKHNLLLIASALFLLASANSHAGRQGVGFYYGVGGGATYPQSKALDVAATGEIMVGFEEDGWNFEIIGFSTMNGGTSTNNVDYSVRGNQFAFGYRTIERNNMYYKLGVGMSNMDFDFTSTSPTLLTSGTSYNLGIGWRMDREERMEVAYSYYSSDDLIDPVHMLTLRYLWGGNPYKGRSF